MNVGSLFSGIGGIDLGLERAGMRVVWQCESDPYCRAVLRKHWPDTYCFDDVRTITDAPPVDLICGGFPCQPVSVAGLGKGPADEKWLWPEFCRVVGVLRPRFVLLENVPGLLARGRGMGDVLGSLASLGYDTEWDCVPACAVGAPHIRDRVWVVAYPSGARRRENAGSAPENESADAGRPTEDDHESDGDGEGCGAGHMADADTEGELRQGPFVFQGRRWIVDGGREWSTEPGVGRVADGVPRRMDRLAALGNAVVPQVSEYIGQRILEAEERLVA